jgi:hypothetical protein
MTLLENSKAYCFGPIVRITLDTCSHRLGQSRMHSAPLTPRDPASATLEAVDIQALRTSGLLVAVLNTLAYFSLPYGFLPLDHVELKSDRQRFGSTPHRNGPAPAAGQCAIDR